MVTSRGNSVPAGARGNADRCSGGRCWRANVDGRRNCRRCTPGYAGGIQCDHVLVRTFCKGDIRTPIAVKVSDWTDDAAVAGRSRKQLRRTPTGGAEGREDRHAGISGKSGWAGAEDWGSDVVQPFEFEVRDNRTAHEVDVERQGEGAVGPSCSRALVDGDEDGGVAADDRHEQVGDTVAVHVGRGDIHGNRRVERRGQVRAECRTAGVEQDVHEKLRIGARRDEGEVVVAVAIVIARADGTDRAAVRRGHAVRQREVGVSIILEGADGIGRAVVRVGDGDVGNVIAIPVPYGEGGGTEA